MSWRLGLPGFTQVIPAPTGFSRTPTRISRRDRMAAGNLVEDIIATKYTFTLPYPALTPEQAEVFYTEFSRDRFLEFQYPHNGQTITTMVSVAEMPEFRVMAGSELYNITVTLEEV